MLSQNKLHTVFVARDILDCLPYCLSLVLLMLVSFSADISALSPFSQNLGFGFTFTVLIITTSNTYLLMHNFTDHDYSLYGLQYLGDGISEHVPVSKPKQSLRKKFLNSLSSVFVTVTMLVMVFGLPGLTCLLILSVLKRAVIY